MLRGVTRERLGKRRKARHVDVDEANRDDEIAYLRQSIYLAEVELFEQTLTAFDRFSVRI